MPHRGGRAASVASRGRNPPSTPAPPALRPRPVARLWGMVSGHRWALAFAAVVGAIAVRNLMGLSTTPSGLYADEASIGYNAWSIAHFGVDEHGASLPLFFQAFGEWKNPVYTYALVPFVWLFGLTTAVVRTPAALFGIVTAIALAGFARRATGSKGVALATLLVAGATPWLSPEPGGLRGPVHGDLPCPDALVPRPGGRGVRRAAMVRFLRPGPRPRGVRVHGGAAGGRPPRRGGGPLLWRLAAAPPLDAFIALVAAAYLLLALWAMRAPRAADLLLQLHQHRRRAPPALDRGGAFAGNWPPTSVPPSSS